MSSSPPSCSFLVRCVSTLATEIPWKSVVAECFGTFLLVLLGTGSVAAAVSVPGSLEGIGQVAAVWSMAVTIAITLTGPISGAHLNPAMTLAMALVRRSGVTLYRIVPYMVAQVLGATAAAAVNYWGLYGGTIAAFEKQNQILRQGVLNGQETGKIFGEYIASTVSMRESFLAEALGTAILSAVVFAVTHPKYKEENKIPVPLLVGLTVGALIGVFAPLTQAGFNPARDFGPRLVAYVAGWKRVAFTNWWLYVLAPMIGAPLGGVLVDKWLYADEEK